MLAHQPLGAGTVRGQGDIQPHVEVMLRRQIEQAVEIVQLVDALPWLHPVPVGKAAHNAQAGIANPREVLIPDFLSGRRSTVVLDAYWKRRFGVELELGLSHLL